MTEFRTTSLRACIERYLPTIPALAGVARQLQSLGLAGEASVAKSDLDTLINSYEQCYPLLEKAMWCSDSNFDSLLDCYQSLFLEQDALIRRRAEAEAAPDNNSGDDRYHFILSIPVADRPPHLQACLESILQLCKKFGYGGNTSGYYDRIKVIVAEDSRDENNIRRHIDLVDEYRKKGLQVFHLGQAEQYELLQTLPLHQREQLGNLLTTQTKEKFYLKGQAANRNLSYLKCLQLTQDKHKTLYYLVDSDQSFCVNRQTESGEDIVYALNYFHIIDKIFRSTDILVLTGKLVGDPPVSPAVMAANFLDDVTAFFTTQAATQRDQACQFHELPAQQPGDAAYHDMAGLFGFENSVTTFPYRCQLEGEHDHAACLADFAMRLNDFFFGEHLTRKTLFSYNNGFEELKPARTIYPGNYIVNYEGLKYIIPFGHLRLRMSGPTAGRLIAAEINERFASVNLPMLHRRTSEAGPGDDFRPGVERREAREQQSIDLSNEFERQFFGDLMLFSTEALVKRADVSKPFEKDLVVAVIDDKENELLELYQQKHDAILDKNRRLNDLVFNAGHWWMEAPGLTSTLKQVKTFIDNINHNFGEQSLAWHQIQSIEHRAERKSQIVEALMNYRTERDAWDRLFP